MDYENQKDCYLMIWEENPNKRNVNNEVKFNITDKIKVEVGDQILCPHGMGRNSVYKIIEIIESRTSSFLKMNCITAKTEWFIA